MTAGKEVRLSKLFTPPLTPPRQGEGDFARRNRCMIDRATRMRMPIADVAARADTSAAYLPLPKSTFGAFVSSAGMSNEAISVEDG